MMRTSNDKGIIVDAPEGVEVTFDTPAGTRAWRPAPGAKGPQAVAGAVPDLNDALVDALRSQDLELVGRASLAASGSTTRALAPAAIAAAVGPDEEAVLLVEQDGMYQWVIGRRQDNPQPARATRAFKPDTNIVVFEVPLASSGGTDTQRSLVGGIVGKAVRTFVFRFVARAGVGVAVRALERHVDAGLFAIRDANIETWTPARSAGKIMVAAKADGAAPRVLLLVHGTFSSVIGTFGHLAPTVWGQAFVRACLDHYDLVLGFNHRSLSSDPSENARDLLDGLADIDFGPVPPAIDIITHSRGGLVVRTLLERLAPEAERSDRLSARFNNAILVATTNNGTHLASQENWKSLADLYTTLAVAASHALSLIPGAVLAATILRETVRSLGELVRQITIAGTDPTLVPGLAAMRPNEAFVQDLNGTQEGQFDAADSIYRVVAASFAPSLHDSGTDLPARLLELVGSGFVRQLMRDSPNDLVVDTASMSAIDMTAGDFVKEALNFPDSPQIYHTNYFSRPEIVAVVARWLGLPAPSASADPVSRRGGGAPDAVQVILPGIGDSDYPETPATVDTDVTYASSRNAVEGLARAIETQGPSFVVIGREAEDGQFEHFAFRPEEISGALTGGGDIEGALDFSRFAPAAAPTFGPSGSITWTRPSQAGELRRSVIQGAGKIVGVVPGVNEVVFPQDLKSLSRAVRSDSSLSVIRRIMPTFTGTAGFTVDAPVPPPMAELHRPRPRPALPGGVTTSAERNLRGKRQSPLPRDGGPSSPAPDAAAAEPIFCTMAAEMPPKVRLERKASVEVVLSLEDLDRVASDVSASTSAQVAPNEHMTIDVICKQGFDNADGDDPEIVLPPGPGTPVIRIFDVRATGVGTGEIWVLVRRGRAQVARLVLKPEVVAADAVVDPAASTRAKVQAEPVSGAQPRNVLRIYEKPRDNVVAFRYDLELGDAGVMRRFISEPISADREAFANSIYEGIEQRWTGSNRQGQRFLDGLQAIGVDLWRQMLPEELQRLLWQHRDEIDSIYVVSEEPFIPWELLYMVEPGGVIGQGGRFLAELGLVRWLWDANTAPPTALTVRSGRAFHIVPEYPEVPSTGLRPLPLAQEEGEQLESQFGIAGSDCSPEGVRKLLKGPGAFDLLHFAGHGAAATTSSGEASILLEGEMVMGGYVEMILRPSEVESISNFGKARPIVVLNACQAGRATWRLTGLGGFAKSFLSRRAGVFVGTLWSVGDDTAAGFAGAFYAALAGGATLAAAAKAGRTTAQEGPDPTWLSYAVYGHPEATVTFAPSKAEAATPGAVEQAS